MSQAAALVMGMDFLGEVNRCLAEFNAQHGEPKH
jgi:hypothetical protein